ncbi:MAG: hypothetical protein WAK56_03635 [Candidatus Sulfotelmatobacter sp.]
MLYPTANRHPEQSAGYCSRSRTLYCGHEPTPRFFARNDKTDAAPKKGQGTAAQKRGNPRLEKCRETAIQLQVPQWHDATQGAFMLLTT